jgi:hypothetical protein
MLSKISQVSQVSSHMQNIEKKDTNVEGRLLRKRDKRWQWWGVNMIKVHFMCV